MARIRERISTRKSTAGSAPRKYNVSKLKEPAQCTEYQRGLEVKICEELRGRADTVDEQWAGIAQALKRTAEETLGFQMPTPRSPWFVDECLAITTLKNEAYRRMIQRSTRRAQEIYRERRREEKRTHQRKKRVWENKRMEDIEAHRTLQESRLFFQKVNEGRSAYKPKVTSCTDEGGNLLTDKSDILERWKRHFEETLKTGEMADTMRDPHQPNDAEPPDEEEIDAAIDKLKNNKAPGLDGIQAELIKYGGPILKREIHNLVVAIWEEERMPEEWTKGVICPLHKKGDQQECGNYRGIVLLSCAYKVLSNVLFERLVPHAEREIGGYQAGFRRGRSTTDQIFSLRMMLERGKEHKMVTHHLFIDFKTAYDSIIRSELYQALEEMGIPKKLIRLVRMTMSGSKCLVRIGTDLSDPFVANCGVRQGDALACLLFNFAGEKAVRQSGIQLRATLFNSTVQLLGYADDFDIAARSERALKEAFLSLEEAAKRLGLVVNETKTKYLRAGGANARLEPFEVGPYKFERVDSFVYLGTEVNSNNEVSREINRRVSAANRCYFGLLKHFRSRFLSNSTKINLYKTLVRPVLTYGSEAWALTKADETRLLVFERRMLRRIFGPVREGEFWKRRKNRDLARLYDDIDILMFIKLGRLRWAGHLVRMNDTEIPKKMLTDEIHGKRRVGRPNVRWADSVSADARTLLGVRDWRAAASDRTNWRKLLEEAQTR